ncbi:MAG: hypothetical protein R6V75_06800 [Bacteroidales bacterium]
MSIPPAWRSRFLPGSEGLVESWLNGARVSVRLSRSRLTKHGDYRAPRDGRPALITVNHDLHPVLFTITFCHELAHYRAREKYGPRIRPHGKEWKQEFRLMLKQLLESGLMERGVAGAVYACYFRREAIGSGSCEHLFRAIGLTGGEVPISRVADVPEGDLFTLRNGRTFLKGPKARTRYRCTDKRTGRVYSVHPLAEIVNPADGRG